MRVAVVGCVVSLALAACWGGDDDGNEPPPDSGDDSGCPVEPGRVGELLGYEVVVADDKGGVTSCRYEPGPAVADDHPGANVLVARRRLAEDGYDAAVASVEASAGLVEHLGEGDVDNADRGWVARVGRVVQVGAARDLDLVLVTVADATLDVVAAEEIAVELAGQALG